MLKDIKLPIHEVESFCHKWQVDELALFGSVLRDDFRADSDIDVMVKFNAQAHPTFAGLDRMENELKLIFNREVDLITRKGIESSLNHIRRSNILSSAQVIYAARSSISA
jgi:uncharacterized protein